jgi:hypothetical protein
MVTPRRVKMRQKSCTPPTRVPAEKLVRDIRVSIGKQCFVEDKNGIVLAANNKASDDDSHPGRDRSGW